MTTFSSSVNLVNTCWLFASCTLFCTCMHLLVSTCMCTIITRYRYFGWKVRLKFAERWSFLCSRLLVSGMYGLPEDADVIHKPSLPSSLQVWTEERTPSELLLQVNSSLSPARSVNLRGKESCTVFTRANSTVVISAYYYQDKLIR